MAQLVLTAIGSYFGPLGTLAGTFVGGLIDRRGQRGGNVRPGDLTAPKLTYGSELPRLAGTNITAGYVAWVSTKRAHEETVEAGKGTSEQTVGFTYTCDVEIILGVHDQQTVWKLVAGTRVWVNGDLKYSTRSGIEDGTAEANNAPPWDAIEFCDGGPTQEPWAVREAEVGVGFAPANRGRNSVRITNFQLGNSTVLPSLKFETITAGTSAPGDVFALLNFNDGAGVTTAVDTSSWAHTVTVANMQQATGGAAAFGSTGMQNTGSSSFGLSAGTSVPFDPASQGLCLEARARFGGSMGSGSYTVFNITTDNGSISASVVDDVSPDLRRVSLTVFGETVSTGDVIPPEYPVSIGAHVMWDFDWNPGNSTGTLRIGGTTVLTAVVSSLPAITAITGWAAGQGTAGTGVAADFAVDAVRYTRRRRYTQDHSTPDVAPVDDGGLLYEPGTVTLAAIAAAECARCGIPSALVDTTDIAAVAVRGYPSAGGARSALEQLCRLFRVGLVQDSALRFVRRGSASEATLAYEKLGAGFDRAADEPLEHTIGSDEEIPRKLALTCVGTNTDGDPLTKTGDRGNGSQRRVATLDTPLLLSPAEAQDMADRLAAEQRVEGTSFKVAVSEEYAAHQPTSVVVLTDRDAITYRARIVAENWTLGVHEWELVLDDASIGTQAGIASADREAGISIPAPPLARLYLLDIPLLRLADDGPGEYAAVTATGRFRGVDFLKSADDVTYARAGSRLTTRATAGECDSALPAFSGWGWDNAGVLTVTLDDGAGGTLASATKAAVEASRSLNLAAVGAHGRWEVLQFATATLLTGSTYELRGLLRNLFGTEAANGEHEVGDSFVLLQAAGLMRLPGAVSDLGQTRYYKAVPVGRSESSVSPTSIVCGEQGLLPYAPTAVRNDAGTVRWERRSRHEGVVGADPPLGENTERYDVELYDGPTLEESASGLTEREWTPVTDPSGLTVRVYQLSELVGRGLVAEVELA